MITLDTKQLHKLERDLETFNRMAIPFATRNTINTVAFNVQKEARSNVRRTMTTRNRWTVQSIQVEKSRTLHMRKQSASVGSLAKYMETQEFGGVKTSKGREGVPIPTSFAAGQGRAPQRTKLPTDDNTLATIRLNRSIRGRNRKQTNLMRVRKAVASGRRYTYLDFGAGRKKGIFKVTGGTRDSKRGWPRGAKLDMVWDLSKRSVVIPPNPWLEPASRVAEKTMPAAYEASLLFQAKRHRLFQ